jgi:hypothetical protein
LRGTRDASDDRNRTEGQLMILADFTRRAALRRIPKIASTPQPGRIGHV